MVDYRRLPELLTIGQTCHILNVHPNTLRNWDKEGFLIALRIGGRGDRRYKKDDIFHILKDGLVRKQKPKNQMKLFTPQKGKI